MNIGFDSKVPWWKVEAILASLGSAAKKQRDKAREAGKLADATRNRPWRSQILTTGGCVVLSAVSPETLMARLTKLKGEQNDDAS